MLEGTSKDDLDSAADFFSMLGGETRKRRQLPLPADPDKVYATSIKLLSLTETFTGRRLRSVRRN